MKRIEWAVIDTYRGDITISIYPTVDEAEQAAYIANDFGLSKRFQIQVATQNNREEVKFIRRMVCN